MKKVVLMLQSKPCFLNLKKMKTGKMEKSIVTAVVLIINQTIIMKVWKHRKKVMNQKRKNK